ncbi:MAG: hypothetical protein WCS94_09735 [Verrucomicrobiota bacterium]
MKKLIFQIFFSLTFAALAAVPKITPLGSVAQLLHSPAGVATNAGGRLYVTDPVAGCVVVFDAFGQQLGTRPGFAGPLAIAVAGDGRIYLSEEKSGSVSVFDAQWNLLYQLGSGAGEFLLPAHLAVDPLAPDKVYVADAAANLVRIYQGASYLGQWGGTGAGDGQFDFPAGIFVRTNGEVVVVDQNNDRVQIFTNGGFARKFSLGSGGMLGGPSGRSQALLVDGLGRAFVADTLNGVVQVFDVSSGLLLGSLGAFGPAAGQLNLPLGLVLDGYNRLWVASANNSRLEIFGVDNYFHVTTPLAGGLMAAGNPLLFSAAAGGTNLPVFQWQKNGAAIAGATNATLAVASALTGDSGNYSVVVSNVSGVVTSSVAPVSVLVSPSIVSGPQSESVLAGTAVGFIVLASGTDLHLQWQFNGRNLDAETNASLNLAAVSTAQAGEYSVVVSNAVGQVTSPPAVLNVVAPPLVMDIVSSGMMPGQMFGLTMNLDPGFNYALEASADLLQWQVISSFAGSGGLLDYVDSNSTNYWNRFYRLRWTR